MWILEDKPDLSRWSLKYKAFGRDIEFSWLARNMQLTVSYEVPPILAPVASALQPFLESLLGRGLERFATFSKSYKSDSTL
ncbi:Polyketide cyclase/dehydrase and lipid transport superfamily protein [Prunus dulcis]|uniref:Polyketide cyclase/dehydrase and lipid transport superfamily protein n=1 Tax=Prunus dulcis TaxID=3755 RepID=A0A4Y1R371_PRUDU|nr:Polyketide cyclase/dehydrase and lipid transport superfamily protein [Prunus dulcis]